MMTSESPTPSPGSNIPELSVSELATGLKRTIEDSYARVRVRGELSGIKIAASGHMYGDLKDDRAVLSLVCWKSKLARMPLTPEDGMEVIATGKITTYPARSSYQLSIESLELAGEGALLKMLEERRKKLAAEGLFAEERKRPLPFLPRVIGVVTSPTGAVIRDILHRINDRFPMPVYLWPVVVQGPGAAEQVAAAIEGFNQLPETGGIIPRPDILIVGRGGGSLEDLMAFNEEIVVRAAASSTIPLISAVGHETDTTLIDFAADRRAPTPTAAAEMAVPHRRDLWLRAQECKQRLASSLSKHLQHETRRVELVKARLGDPRRALEAHTQRSDYAAERLVAAIRRQADQDTLRLQSVARLLRAPETRIREAAATLGYMRRDLARLLPALLRDRTQALGAASRTLQAYSYHNVLQRGFAVIRDRAGKPVSRVEVARKAEEVALEFADGQVAAQIVNGNKTKPDQAKKSSKTAKKAGDGQQTLF